MNNRTDKTMDDPRVTAYALNELSAADRSAFEVQLAAGAELRAEVGAVRALAAELGRTMKSEACPRLRDGQRETLLAGRPPPSARGWSIVFWSAAAVAASLAVCGLLITQWSDGGSRRVAKAAPVRPVAARSTSAPVLEGACESRAESLNVARDTAGEPAAGGVGGSERVSAAAYNAAPVPASAAAPVKAENRAVPAPVAPATPAAVPMVMAKGTSARSAMIPKAKSAATTHELASGKMMSARALRSAAPPAPVASKADGIAVAEQMQAIAADCAPMADNALPAAVPATYTVQPGDTLSGIAKKMLGDASRWPEIIKLNPGLTPETLKPGQTIILPAIPAP